MAAYLGADRMVVPEQIVGQLLGQTVRLAPSDFGPLVLAVRRGGVLLWLDDPNVANLRTSDRLLAVRASTRDE